ncbi:MAG TPA: hypothetical protein VGX28_07080 [Frankiaceae bacterium]|nr:hypothetical protein [Frankiaceae bacterium]
MTEEELHPGMRVLLLPYETPYIVVEKESYGGHVSALVEREQPSGCDCGCSECCGPLYWSYPLDRLRPA